MLTFVIPVRHPSSVKDWGRVKDLMRQTLASVAAQTDPRWDCVIAAEAGTDLPGLPAKARVVRTDIPAPNLPDVRTDKAANFRAVREDKGARILAALVEAQPEGHVMVVDYDDLISRRLATLAAAHPEAPGWYFDRGLLYSGGWMVSVYPEAFNFYCGTSHIVHSRLMRIPASATEADPDWVARIYGSHVYVQGELAAAGTPLVPLPFIGTIYRVGHEQTSRAAPVYRRVLQRRTLKAPAEMLGQLARLRPLGPGLRREFFGA